MPAVTASQVISTCPVSSSSANSPSLQSSFQTLSQTCRCSAVSSLIVSTGSHIHSNCYAVRRPRAMSRSPPAQIHLFPDTIHSMTDQRRYERMRIKSSFPGKKSRFCIIFHLPFAASLRLFFPPQFHFNHIAFHLLETALARSILGLRIFTIFTRTLEEARV